ncbi:MAG: hypothetical protein ACRDPC_22190 [Solirubrobacteraceae bacterium]
MHGLGGGAALAVGLPGGQTEQHERRRPAGADEGVRLVGAGRDLQQVDGVAEEQQGERAGHQQPGAVHPPAVGREREDKEPGEQQVGERVGEIDRDGLERAAGMRRNFGRVY